MKILFLASRLPYPPNRGDKLRVFNFLSRLSKKHSITLLSFIESNEQIIFAEELKKYCRDVEVVLLKPWQSYLNCLLYLFSRLPLQVGYYHSRKMRNKLQTLLGNNKFDAIYVHLFRMAPYVQDLKNVRRILDLCDAVSLHLKRTIKFKKSILWPVFLIEYLRVKRYEKNIIKKFDKTILISSIDKQAIVETDAYTEIIHNGVDSEYFRPNILSKNRMENIVFLGYLSTFYNLDAVLYFYDEILPEVRRHLPDVKFSVVGANRPPQLKRLEKDNNVEIVGELPDTRPFLSKSSVFVCPLRIGSGLQNKILEAMAMGLPVITTSVGYEGVGAAKGREIIVEDEPEKFAQKIIELLKNEKLRHEISCNARNFIEKNYKWEDSISEIESLFTEGKAEIRKNYEGAVYAK